MGRHGTAMAYGNAIGCQSTAMDYRGMAMALTWLRATAMASP